MKFIKRILAAFLILALAFSLALPALAEENDGSPEYGDTGDIVSGETEKPSFFQRVGSVLRSIFSFLGSIFIGGPMFVLVWGTFFGGFGLAALIGAPLMLPYMLFEWIAGLFR